MKNLITAVKRFLTIFAICVIASMFLAFLIVWALEGAHF